MFPTLVLAWAPQNDSGTQHRLLEKLQRRIRRWNLDMASAIINPTQEALEKELGRVPSCRQLVLSWVSVPMEVPSWIFEIKAIRRMHGLHICSYDRNPVQQFVLPSVKTEKRNPLSTDRRLYLFANGWWVSPKLPYAMKKAEDPGPNLRKNNGSAIRCYDLFAGDAQQLEVVRLVFDMYGLQRQSVGEIVNLLRAEKVSAGDRAKVWSYLMVERLLTDPVYIGAYRYKTFVRYAAFPAVIEPWIYYVAQARLYSEKAMRERSILGNGLIDKEVMDKEVIDKELMDKPIL